MKLCENCDIERVVEFLRNDIPNCFYIYVDFCKYKLNNPNITFWINEDIEISTIVMKYFDSIQVYSSLNNNIQEIANIIAHENVPIITGNYDTCYLLNNFISHNYFLSEGYELEIKKFPIFNYNNLIIPATYDELDECAELVCSDEDIGGYYEKEKLALQYKERMLDNMGRNFIIKKNGVIVGHIATYAEFENLAVCSGLIVKSEFRKLGYGAILESFLINKLLNEGKRVFSFLRSNKRINLFKKISKCTLYKNAKFTLIC